MMARPTTRGFTLLEVMMGLALLGFALVVLLKSAAGSIFNAQQAQMMGVVTELSRGKLYDIEEKLIKDGFTETDQSEESLDFTEEGWPNIKYSYLVEEVELPSWDTLQAMSKGKEDGSNGSGSFAGSGSGAGSAGDPSIGGFQNSALGGMLGMMGGGFGGGAEDASEAAGAAMVSSQYSMFQEILKVSLRKVTLTVTWQVMGRDRDLKSVVFFTDPGAMDKVLKGMGATELPPDTGSGSGKGSGSGSGTTRPPRTQTPRKGG